MAPSTRRGGGAGGREGRQDKERDKKPTWHELVIDGPEEEAVGVERLEALEHAFEELERPGRRQGCCCLTAAPRSERGRSRCGTAAATPRRRAAVAGAARGPAGRAGRACGLGHARGGWRAWEKSVGRLEAHTAPRGLFVSLPPSLHNVSSARLKFWPARRPAERAQERGRGARGPWSLARLLRGARGEPRRA